ncbi:arginase family protein [Streptomyces antimycoticus]|uniref:arginase family protein n=1 Tax=Streptomyces antimycoticus TaxID=68175 RepID=UPI0037D8046E
MSTSSTAQVELGTAVAYEHVYWDQAAVLAQVGLLDRALGGECAVSVAPFAELARCYGDELAVIWIDSHPDIGTPGAGPRGSDPLRRACPRHSGQRAPAARHRHPPENQWSRTPVCRYGAPAHSHSVKDMPLYTK